MTLKYSRHFLVLLLLFSILSMAPGCADMEFSEGSFVPGDEDVPARSAADAEIALRQNDLSEARRIYASRLDQFPEDGHSAAGLGIIDLLLLPGAPEITEVLLEGFNANRGLNASELIYGDGGYLYWASRGARWEDHGSYQGIRELLGDDLPWSRGRLESLTAFVEGLDEPFDKSIRKLVTLANAMQGLDLLFETAIADPAFVRFYLPGQVLHDSELTLILGRSELSMLRAKIALFRSAIYFLAAYEHSWTLEGAFGSWRFDVALDNRHYVPGFEPKDYTIAYLDDRLFRRLSSPERLAASRSALRHAFRSYGQAIRQGLEETSTTTLNWESFTVEEAKAYNDFFAALSDSLDGPVTLPDTEITLNLAPLFKEGRSLPAEIPWFVQIVEFGDAPGNGDDRLELRQWKKNDEAITAFLYDGVLEPRPPSLDLQKLDNYLLPGEDGLEGFFSPLIGHYLEVLGDVYFSTR